MTIETVRYTTPSQDRIEVTHDNGRKEHMSLPVVGWQAEAFQAWLDRGNQILDAPEEPAVDLAAYAADARWRKEIGGLSFNGMTIATDDRSKLMIMGARIEADRNANFTTQWKSPDGSFVTIPAETIIAISDAVLGHVAACFERESAVLAAIAAGTVTTKAEIDAAFVDVTALYPPA